MELSIQDKNQKLDTQPNNPPVGSGLLSKGSISARELKQSNSNILIKEDWFTLKIWNI